MAKFRIKTAFTRMQLVEGSDPKQPTYNRVHYPAGSVIEPTNAEYNAFKDVLERVEDSTPLTELGKQHPQADPNAPYDPDAASPAGEHVAGTVSGGESAATGSTPDEGATDPAPTTRRR